jgi:hypothetical protein
MWYQPGYISSVVDVRIWVTAGYVTAVSLWVNLWVNQRINSTLPWTERKHTGNCSYLFFLLGCYRPAWPDLLPHGGHPPEPGRPGGHPTPGGQPRPHQLRRGVTVASRRRHRERGGESDRKKDRRRERGLECVVVGL